MSKPAVFSELAPCIYAIEQWSALLEDVLGQFWEQPFTLSLLSVRDKKHAPPLVAPAYYSLNLTLRHIEPAIPEGKVRLRLSEDMCLNLLELVLGAQQNNQQQASLRTLSRLEQVIIQNLAMAINQRLNAHWQRELPPEEDWKAHSPIVQVVWLLQAGSRSQSEGKRYKPQSEILGSILISLPLDLLQQLALQEPQRSVTQLNNAVLDPILEEASSTVTLCAGRTSLTLQECQNLEPEDLLILEQSSTRFLGLLRDEEGKEIHGFPFATNGYWPEALPDATLLSEAEDPAMPTHESMPAHKRTTTMASKTTPPQEAAAILEQLHVEVNACFEPMQLPIHQIRQMSEGLVVEVGDLLNNRITLQVNGKPIAEGELMVIGEKFGVLITSVPGAKSTALAKSAESASITAPAAETQAPQNDEPELPELDEELLKAVTESGLNAEQLVQAAIESGRNPNEYLAEVLEDRQAPQEAPKAAGKGTPAKGKQAASAEELADEALAEVDRLLDE